MPLVLKPQKRISQIDFDAVDLLAKELCVSKLFAQVLYNRGFLTADDCKKFLQADDKTDYDAFSMLNMSLAVDKIKKTVARGGKICVFGDYDVDGVCACTILVNAIKILGGQAEAYIPSRHNEGYGLNETALDNIFESGVSLVVTVDCGIASADIIAKQLEKGRDIIVSDHHAIQEKIPACIVLKPGQPGDEYKNPNLCGAGIAFKLAQALIGKKADEFIDHACVATVADIVPLTDENRYIVKKGLEKFNAFPRKCYSELLLAAGFSGKVTAQTIAFTIAPRINAAGRMADATEAFELLNNEKGIAEKAKKLNELNSLRQNTEKEIFAFAREQIISTNQHRDSKFLIAFGNDWDEGVIGICAARLVEEFHRPTIVFSVDGNCAKGSARSVDGVNIFEVLSSAKHILTQFGGHAMAAGMSIETNKIQHLHKHLNDYIKENYENKLFYPVACYDAKASLNEITLDFCKEIEKLEPCGCANPEITLRVDNCVLGGARVLGVAANHLKFYLQDEQARLNAIAFNYKKHECDYFNSSRISCIVRPEINVWQNNESVNLKVSNAKPIENIRPLDYAQELTSAFFEQLAYKKENIAKVEFFENHEDFAYFVADNDEISGTLIVCNHPDYASSCVRAIEEEAPRFDVSLGVPISCTNGYNSLVLAPDEDAFDFSAFSTIIIYGLINYGYADMLAKKAPCAKIYALKGDRQMFAMLFEEYKQFSREEMLKAYKVICASAGKYATKKDAIKSISQKNAVSMPNISVALTVFEELGFINCDFNQDFVLQVVKNPPKRKLEESKFYLDILKCF